MRDARRIPADTIVKKSGRERRGQVSPTETLSYCHLSCEELMVLLQASDARTRTVGAILLGEHRCVESVPALCRSLTHEKSLYPRLAAAEALAFIGESAVDPLCELLGMIGHNQENGLPQKCCDKKSFPLVRDLAGRTLVKIGKPAVPTLGVCLKKGEIRRVREAIDALGAIGAKTGEITVLPGVLQTMTVYRHDDFMLWKFVRALGGFRHADAAVRLLPVLTGHAQPALRWEAARSLGQIRIANPEIVDALRAMETREAHPEVRRAIQASWRQLVGAGE